MKTRRSTQIQTIILVSLFFLASNLTASAQGRVDKDTVYGILSGLSLTMDVYYPADSIHRGVILIPGSGWDGRESGYTDWQVKAGSRYINQLRDVIVEAGFTVFMPNHRMAPVHKYPAAVDDARRAVRFIRHHAAEFSIDAVSLGAVGHSSGGHLVGMLGVLDDDPELQKSPHAVERESSRVQAVVTIAAPHDLTVNTPIYWPFTASFMGDRPPMDANFSEFLREGLYAEASTVTHVTPDDAAFMLIHATEDIYITPKQLPIMTEAVQAAGLPLETVSIDVNSHMPPLDHASIVRWLKSQLL